MKALLKSLSVWRVLWIFILISSALFGGEKSDREDENAPLEIVQKPEKPYPCVFGVYPVGVWDFNYAKKIFQISFYAWWRTKDKTYRPEKSVEITNATEYRSKFGARGKNGDEYFMYIHYYATIQKDWDFKFFPFDRQSLEVRLEDFADTSFVIFEPDDTQSHLHNEMVISGWTLKGLRLKKSLVRYLTNFGNISEEEKNSDYSRLTFFIDLKREGWQPFFNYFLGFFVSFFLCSMMFFVDLHNLNARASLFLGSIYVATGNKYVLDQIIPLTSTFSLADAIQIATFVSILLSTLSIIFIHFQVRKNGEVVALKYNYYLCGAIMSSYIIFVSAWVFKAATS